MCIVKQLLKRRERELEQLNLPILFVNIVNTVLIVVILWRKGTVNSKNIVEYNWRYEQ